MVVVGAPKMRRRALRVGRGANPSASFTVFPGVVFCPPAGARARLCRSRRALCADLTRRGPRGPTLVACRSELRRPSG